jgi:cellobiose phosphorylase
MTQYKGILRTLTNLLSGRGLVVGFFPDRAQAEKSLKILRDSGFTKSAMIHHAPDGHIRVDDYVVSPQKAILLGLTAGVVMLIIFHIIELFFSKPADIYLPLWMDSLFPISGMLLGWILSYLIDFGVDGEIIARYKRWTFRGETALLIQTPNSQTGQVHQLIRDAVGGVPVSFVFHPTHTYQLPEEGTPLREEPLTVEKLNWQAGRLAASIHKVKAGKKHGRPLLQRLTLSEKVLSHIRQTMADDARTDLNISLSAEWLLDNMYIIQSHIDETRRNLPRKYYEELPIISEGIMEGLPRIYAIACEMISDTDAHLDKEIITNFIQSYQSFRSETQNSILTMGELWAIPLMLRLRLVESLHYLAIQVDRRQTERENADFWANRLLTAVRNDPDRLLDILAELAHEHPKPSAFFADQLVGHLYDEESALIPVRNYLERKLNMPIADAILQEQRIQASEQVSLANAITSLRHLSQLDWRQIFENLCRVDAVLWADPAGIYSEMDFETRDIYRHEIERISKITQINENVVALKTLDMAESAIETYQRHVGYYLIDKGNQRLEKDLSCRAPFIERIRRGLTARPALSYISGILLFSGIAEFLLIANLAILHAGMILTACTALLAIIPASEIAVQCVNFLIARIIPPRILPKMNFEDGIPDNRKTLVVVPLLLSKIDDIQRDVENLEIRYLANPSKNIRFALFSDFTDAPEEHMPEDDEKLDIAIQATEKLNERYEEDIFYLFHRPRIWCQSEQCWMGWERKRGKLEQLNRYLMGENDPELDVLLRVGSPEQLSNIRYVITLDADTQLPCDSARHLIETMAHPLNEPHIGADGQHVERGYVIVQPRVSTSLPSATGSVFSRIFTDASGIDPYTHAVSDVYQDLAGEGSYHGKGIYDLRAFHQVLTGRFPESHLLSHDLIEGAHVRVGLASDIELFDLFPQNYLAFSSRQHRWIRGDWQIIDWLSKKVPHGTSEPIPNPLNSMNRWKIFDNLRRSLSPVFLTLLLLFGWLFNPSPWSVSIMAACIFLLPAAFQLLSSIATPARNRAPIWKEPSQEIIRALVNISLLPHQATLALDAIGRVFYRRYVSHKMLLEWQTAQEMHQKSVNLQRMFLLRMVWLSVFSVMITAMVSILRPESDIACEPFVTLWMFAPLTILWMNQTEEWRRNAHPQSNADQRYLRHIARQTWRFFDEFVNAKTNWLPPDNYQEFLRHEVAERTSPTNIGLYLLSTIAANDLGYETTEQTIERLLKTMETLERLERYEGHLLNWYATNTLEPLRPRYVSMVDSGNLAGCLWTLEQAVMELIDKPLLSNCAIRGIADTLSILGKITSKEKFKRSEIVPLRDELGRLVSNPPESFTGIISRLQEMREPAQKLTEFTCSSAEKDDLTCYWLEQISCQIESWNQFLETYFGWVNLLNQSQAGGHHRLSHEAHEWKRIALLKPPSLRELAEGNAPGLIQFTAMHARMQDFHLSEDQQKWLQDLAEETANIRWKAEELLTRADGILKRIRSLCKEIRMDFLYDRDRRVFYTGYNVSERRYDNSYYDLLASEARIGSLVAIAGGQVSAEHWWALGRPYGVAYRKRPLLSWSGTMFEYLMPLLLMKRFRNSMLDHACITAVECQVEYAKSRGIPWGISEAAFSALDSHQIYQYRAFGVPGLGLKRGLEEDTVVAPYASALALAIDPGTAIKNLLRLGKLAEINPRNKYGYFEAIDYTRQTSTKGDRGVIVYTYMAHHQGMILLSIDNVLHNQIMPQRFHSDPRVRAVESLLYERIPVNPPLAKDYARESPPPRLAPIPATPGIGRYDAADTPTPKTHLLSNRNYSVMITNSGAGYSRWKDIDITRWRSDTTRDIYGSFIYLRDMESDTIWSIGYHPIDSRPSRYSVFFSNEKAEIRRREMGIEARMEIVVSMEDDAEIRRITLTNRSLRKRKIELTSCLELSLSPHNADRAHPAFVKLFIQTEAVPEYSALLAWKRTRAPEDPTIYTAHQVVLTETPEDTPEYETDRNAFMGRGRSLANPAAMDGALGNNAGAVLDPIFSLRRSVSIEGGKSIQLSFVTMAASTREEINHLIEKYADNQSILRAFDMAWNQGQIELRHLRIQQEEALTFQQMAGYMLFPQAQYRPPAERLRKNNKGQSGLWTYGISGDLPIIVVTIGDSADKEVVVQALQAHTFWFYKGLKTDLVILNEEYTIYDQPLMEQLRRLIQSHAHITGIDQPGGIYLRSTSQIPSEDLTLLLSAAHVVLVASRGELHQQLGSTPAPPKIPPRFTPSRQLKEEPSAPLPFMELQYFNGLGGFTEDGKEYAIYLGPGSKTPAPWSNILANPQFGALITESGGGFCWKGNSQSNRITAWSNDPLEDPVSEAIYIRDQDMGVYWTPTPSPVREEDAYRCRHGQGYTIFEHNSHAIEQELTVFVPMDDNGGKPVRIQRLLLKNSSTHRRRLLITNYCEWTLGTDREISQLHIATRWDMEAQAMMAQNSFNPDFGSSVAFLACDRPVTSYSGNRTTFIGRNGSLMHPAAMEYARLDEHTGPALDPCSAIQAIVEIDPGQTAVVHFFLGESEGILEARALLSSLRSAGVSTDAFNNTVRWWDHILEGLHVSTPVKSTDILVNRWLPYQNIVCRLWARSAFYQSGGAWGFRDQLQDSMDAVYYQPDMEKEQIIRSAARQFTEGDVQHWWHLPSGSGVRTRISDDLLWLPYVTLHYIRCTGDESILSAQIPFLTGDTLQPDEQERMFIPGISTESYSLLEHCLRAIRKSMRLGQHGLPLIGAGDWNDGLNRVGKDGNGESVWLAWFLADILMRFAEFPGIETPEKERMRTHASAIVKQIEAEAWDGQWYKRAWFDDGSPLGSSENEEMQIDSLPQTWAVISGLAKRDRTEQAMNSSYERLVDSDHKLVKLFTPPFDRSSIDPGYIRGYLPGVRENGGQYTHGSLWMPLAFAILGEGDRAVELLKMMNPIEHAHNLDETDIYRVEPYVTAGDVYSLPGKIGRGGWTWYSGSAGWMHRIWVEEVLGLKLNGDQLIIDPVIPSNWEQYEMHYRRKQASYHIKVLNPEHITRGVKQVILNGTPLAGNAITLRTDVSENQVEVILGRADGNANC